MSFDHIWPLDFQDGRILARLTVNQLAAQCHVSRILIDRLEKGDTSVKTSSRNLIGHTLERFGVKFERPGVITHPTYGRAPTLAAVGLLTPSRLKKARLALKWHETRLASESGTGTEFVRRFEKPDAKFTTQSAIDRVRLFNALERGGYRFFPDQREDKRWTPTQST